MEVAIFLYETGPQQYKVSLRSQKIVDVSQVAFYFGGGGHVRAAGCTMSGSIHDVINNLSLHIAKQLDAAAAWGGLNVHGIINVYKEPGYTPMML